jgi:hypothetical protein
MNRGIYIVANDKVTDHAIALVNSIRCYNPEMAIVMIPFDDNYHGVSSVLSQIHGVEIFPDLELVHRFTKQIADIFPRDFLALPNKMRKLIAWFGPLDEFIYIDTDIIIFDSVSSTLDKLSEFGFICCDYHHLSEGIRNIFSPMFKEQKIFSEQQLQDVFNSGFWASKKEVLTAQQMEEILRECAAHKEYFDFTQGVTDQPILNYLVLKHISQRCNLVKIPGEGTGSWAGSPHFQAKEYVLYDNHQRLEYLHWAGISIQPGCPYWEIWNYYRHLNKSIPPAIFSTPIKKNKWQMTLDKFTKSFQ